MVLVADELGLFDLLHTAPATSDELCAALELSPRGIEALVAVLAGAGFVVKRLDRFHLTDVSRAYLLKESEFYWLPMLRGPGWGFTLGFGIVTDPAAAKTRLPAGSYSWGGIYGTQFWVDPSNKVIGLVMTQTAIIGSGAISNPVREAFYTAD